MKTERVLICLPEELLNTLDTMAEQVYSSRSEFIRYLIRKELTDLRENRYEY